MSESRNLAGEGSWISRPAAEKQLRDWGEKSIDNERDNKRNTMVLPGYGSVSTDHDVGPRAALLFREGSEGVFEGVDVSKKRHWP